jgi:hypothetical protein
MTYSERVAERREWERGSDNIVAAIYGATVTLCIVALAIAILFLVSTGAV